MFNKKFSLLLAGAALTGILAMAPLVFAAEGGSQLKIFTRDAQIIESAVNDWLTGQKNIVVDQIKANSYGGDYAVIISYHTGGVGGVLTRIKIFNSNTLTGGAEDNDKTPEIRAQEFISSLSFAHTIRSADIFAGSGPWDIFIVYDENPIQGVVAEVQSVPIIEKIESFIENIINPSGGETGAETPAASTEELIATTTTGIQAADDTSTSTTGTSTTTIQTPAAPTEEQTGGQSEVLDPGAFTSLLTASIFNAGYFLFNNQIGGVVFLLLLLALIYFVSELFRKWKNKD